jgi:hypothetical protein
MEEEELGSQRVIGHKEYVTCARCERPIAVETATAVRSDALESQSDYEYLCPECVAALEDGEQDLPQP